MKAAFAAIKPGMRDTEVAAVAVHYSQDHGCENGIYLCASTPLGQPAKFGQRHVQNRTIQKGDTRRAAGRGFRPRRHVHRARPLLRARQGAAADEGRARVREGVAQAHPRHAQARHALQGHLGDVQRLHAQERPARGGAALLPRPGLRPGRAAADPQRRAVDDREGHEHRRAPDLSATAAISTGCATTTSSAATAPATASTSSRKRSSRSTCRSSATLLFAVTPRCAAAGRASKRRRRRTQQRSRHPSRLPGIRRARPQDAGVDSSA